MRQKIIKIGSSIGVVMPKQMAEEYGFKLGQEVSSTFSEKGDFVVHKHTEDTNQDVAQAVTHAKAYIEKYRKDFEALADK